MNRFNIKNHIPLIISTIVMLLISLIWDKISLPFNNPDEIVGEYSKLSHHQFNDTLRFLLFILLPIFSYLTSYILLYKNKIKTIKEIIYEKNIKYVNKEKNGEKYIFLLIFFVIILFDFFFSRFTTIQIRCIS